MIFQGRLLTSINIYSFNSVLTFNVYNIFEIQLQDYVKHIYGDRIILRKCRVKRKRKEIQSDQGEISVDLFTSLFTLDEWIMLRAFIIARFPGRRKWAKYARDCELRAQPRRDDNG